MGPLGGGSDYTDGISQSDADVMVTSADGLATAVSETLSGDTIFIPSDASGVDSAGLIADGGGGGQTVLELDAPLEVSANEVTIASERGANGSNGAIPSLPTAMDSQSQVSLIHLIRDACRVTGLTIEGPESGATGDPEESPYATGICLDGGGCEVDNCEIRDFPTDGVHVGQRQQSITTPSMTWPGESVSSRVVPAVAVVSGLVVVAPLTVVRPCQREPSISILLRFSRDCNRSSAGSNGPGLACFNPFSGFQGIATGG